MNTFISDLKKHFDSVVVKLKEELKTIRTTHASPALLENVEVDVYEGTMKMKLMELATITNESATSLAIVPFDPTTTQDIERGILKSPLGLSPTTQTNKIIVSIPPLSEEQRTKYVKLVNEFAEEHRHIVRGYRDDVRKKVKASFEAKEMGEDEKFRLEKAIDEATQQINETINEIKEKKEKEIQTI